jgi:hypothetical protein
MTAGNLVIRTRLRPLAEMPLDQEMRTWEKLGLGGIHRGLAGDPGERRDLSSRYKIAARITRDVGPANSWSCPAR